MPRKPTTMNVECDVIELDGNEFEFIEGAKDRSEVDLNVRAAG
jgi:hypothetical protein